MYVKCRVVKKKQSSFQMQNNSVQLDFDRNFNHFKTGGDEAKIEKFIERFQSKRLFTSLNTRRHKPVK